MDQGIYFCKHCNGLIESFNEAGNHQCFRGKEHIYQDEEDNSILFVHNYDNENKENYEKQVFNNEESEVNNSLLSAICRTCLSKREDLRPIFPSVSEETENQFLDSFFTITGLKVKIDDGLPQNICKKCTDLFNSTQNFRTTCKEAETRLLNMREKIKDAIKKEVILPEATLFNINDELNISMEQKPVKTESKEHETFKKPNFLKNEGNKSNKGHFKEIMDKKVKESKLYVLDVTDSKQKRVICILCQKRLSIKSFWTHMSRSHPGVDDRQVKCDLCDYYIMKEKMNRHKKLMHGNSFKCRYCKCEFKEKDKLVEHVASCPEKKKRKDYETSREMVECDICSKTMQKGSLRVHKAIKHAGLGPVCDHCGKRFGNKLRLNEHYRAKHGYEKFKCSECEFQSASIIALKNHERRHRGEKPFVCETCGADFHAAYLLVQHRHSHRTDKRFKCDKCPASFKARNSLHTHTRSCHTQTRVTCSVCARAYSCRHYALKHMRAVHRYTGPVPPLHTHAHDAVINK